MCGFFDPNDLMDSPHISPQSSFVTRPLDDDFLVGTKVPLDSLNIDDVSTEWLVPTCRLLFSRKCWMLTIWWCLFVVICWMSLLIKSGKGRRHISIFFLSFCLLISLLPTSITHLSPSSSLTFLSSAPKDFVLGYLPNEWSVAYILVWRMVFVFV